MSTTSETMHDAIRIVPIHQPKTKVAGSALGKQTEDSDLFAAGKKAPQPSAQLVYNGGALIKNVEVFTVFWGHNWAHTPSYVALADKINQFFKDILSSPLIDQLAEYNTPNYKIGAGSFVGTATITAHAPVSNIKDSQIQKVIAGWIKSKTLPKVTSNSLYFVYTDINVKVSMGGSASCSAFCGYHNHFQNTYYAVMPFPGCAGCLGGLSVFDSITATSSHELCEAITDPVPGEGWYDQANGEIGDICAWQYKKVKGYNVQLEWSNHANACI